ncbi:MAG: AAA family ATPase [Chitinophagaceae bacterium]
MIVIVFGLPGSGKSYLASQLADIYKAEYISSDRLRKEMVARRIYSEDEKLLVYDEMLQRMKKALENKTDLVIDATFYLQKIRNNFIQNANEPGDIIFIEVTAEESLIRKRLLRKRQDSDADFEVYKKIKEKWEPLHEPHLEIQSTDDNIKYLLNITEHYLHSKNDARTNI